MNKFIIDNFKHQSDNLCGNNPGQRFEHIDLAKGICIILVVILHTDGLSYELPGLNLLRMPLFFFISGYLFKQYGDFKSFLYKKISALIIPCFFFEFLYVIPKWAGKLYTTDEAIRGILCIDILNIPLWFLLSLFSVNIIFYGISFIRNKYISASIIIVFGYVGYVLSHHSSNAFLVGTTLSSLPTFYIGYLCRNKTPLLSSIDYNNKATHYIRVILSLIVFFGIIILNQYVQLPQLWHLQNVYLGNPILYYIISTIMIISFLQICHEVKWLPIISYMGKYSIIILCVHAIIQAHASTPIYWITGHSIANIEILAVMLIGSWLSIPILCQYAPYFTAQKNIFEYIFTRDAITAIK